MREADLERHLENDKDKGAPPAKGADKSKAPAPNGKGGKGGKEEGDEAAPVKPFEFASRNDYQLKQAMNLLKAWQIIRKP